MIVAKSPAFLPNKFKEQNPDYVIHRGDLLISMTGTIGKEDYGNVCMDDVEDAFLLNQRVAKFDLDCEKVVPKFIYYYTISDDFRTALFLNSAGGVRQANISN